MVATVDRFATRDGTSLLVRRWPSTAGPAWATVVLVHGLAEHSGRWNHVGSQLAAAGLDVEAMDLRGFGGSSGRRAWVERWSQLHDDLEERLVAIRAAGPNPVALYGHSMGGLIALGYVLDGRALPDVLVLSAPAMDVSIPAWKRALAQVLARVAPTMRMANGLDHDELCRVPAVVAAYGPDPMNVHTSTVGFGVRAFTEQRRVAAAIGRLSLPTLVIHGGEDRIVPTAGSEVFEGRAGVTRRVYPGIRHELHNEPEGPAILDDVIAWLRDHLPRR
ncbi:MAG TPA: lysophospholipase [Candidatus Acidoferrales bacterium]|jgi:alpha-beta hydrolase superfamily lysophospholipase|nr:lysophospholipase [Candidatus Acidoferrales bacterium]